MGWHERLQTPAVLLAALTGLAVGAVADLDAARALVLPVLGLLLVGVFLGVRWHELRRAATRPRALVVGLALNALLAPALAWALGAVLLPGHPELRLGLLLLLVAPCTDWYLVFTRLAGGHTALATLLLPPNLLLQLVLLPLAVAALGAGLVPVDPAALLGAIGLVVVLPAGAAAVVRLLARRARREPQLGAVVAERLGPWTLAALVVAVGAMFAAEGHTALAEPTALLALLPPLLAFFAVAYAVATGAARLAGLRPSERAAVTMTAMARNSPLALAVAIAAFGERPMIALALVAAPLVELPVLGLAARRLRLRVTQPAPER